MKRKFFNIVSKLDEIIDKEDIAVKDVAEYQALCSSIEAKIYFYRNLSHPSWFSILNESNEFYDLLSQDSKDNNIFSLQNALSNYLQKIVSKYPSEVVDLIKRVKTNNNTVIWNFVEIGLQLDAIDTAKLVPEVKKWINNPNLSATIFDSEIIKWLKQLAEGKQYNASFKLLKILTTPRVQKPLRQRDRKVEKIIGRDRPKAIPAIDYYYLKELLSKGLNELIEYDPFELSKILQSSLEKTIKIEFSYVKDGSDLSYIWRAAIEDHSQNYEYYELKEALLVALRNSTEEVAKRKKGDGLILIKQYLNHKYSIFKRLAIHLLRLNYDEYESFIGEFIKDKELLTEVDISHEYYLLLRDIYENMGEEKREFIISSILAHKSFNPNAKPEIQEKQIRYYWLEKLNFFAGKLEGSYKELYDELKKEFQEEKLRDTTVYHESYTGERSPLSVNQLSEMSMPDLWNYLKTFIVTKKGFDAPTPEGLARILGQAVKNNPDKYLSVDLTPMLDLRPNYSYWFLNQVADIYKSEKYIGLIKYLDNLLIFISRVIKIEDIPERFIDQLGINFSGVKRRAIDVIQALIKTHQREFLLTHKDELWEIIEYLCFYEGDPIDDPLKDDSNMDPVTRSLNSVRGNALHTVIDYALWYAYHTKSNYPEDERYPNRFTGEERIQYLLEDKLNKKNDPSLAIHSTFGLLFANLAYLNFDWLKVNRTKIFPREKENKIYWETAWGAYINSTRFYNDLYKEFYSEFSKALEYLAKGNKIIKSGFGRSPEDALSEHLVVACLNGLDDIYKKNSLLRKFAEISSNPSATHVAQFISNLAKDERIFIDDIAFERKSFWPQAKEYWIIRMRIVKKLRKKSQRILDEDPIDQEVSRFISWLDELPEEITVQELEPLLIETIKINRKGWRLPDLIKYLSRQSAQHPMISIRLLYRAMKNDSITPRHFYSGKEEEIGQILTNAIKTDKPEAYYYADYIVNTFGEWGNYYFKDFWMEYLKGKKVKRIVKISRK